MPKHVRKPSWEVRWSTARETLRTWALPVLGKNFESIEARQAALHDLLILAQEIANDRVEDSGSIAEIRESLAQIAKFASALEEGIRMAPNGVFSAMAGTGVSEPMPWIDALRIAGPIRPTDILTLGEDGEIQDEPPSLAERLSALSKAASASRDAILRDARHGGNRDWETYRRGSRNLDVMKECLLFLVDRGIPYERKLKGLARSVRWAIDGTEPALGWGQNEYDQTVLWWKDVREFYGMPQSDWPQGKWRLFLQGPVAIKSARRYKPTRKTTG